MDESNIDSMNFDEEQISYHYFDQNSDEISEEKWNEIAWNGMEKMEDGHIDMVPVPCIIL